MVMEVFEMPGSAHNTRIRKKSFISKSDIEHKEGWHIHLQNDSLGG